MWICQQASSLLCVRIWLATFVGEMRLAAAVKWYEMREISQAKAAEIAGLSRSEFLTALARFGVSPFQYDANEIVYEVEGG